MQPDTPKEAFKIINLITLKLWHLKDKSLSIPSTAKAAECIELSKEVNGKGYNFTHTVNDSCIGCASCAMVCPDGVISVYKKKI